MLKYMGKHPVQHVKALVVQPLALVSVGLRLPCSDAAYSLQAVLTDSLPPVPLFYAKFS